MFQRFAFPALAIASMLLTTLSANAEDWPRFRGPAGSGVTTEALPTTWSPKANLAWKAELPGPGASSPIIIGDKAFVTCYSGYGLSQEAPGDIEKLMRHLVCIDMKTGKKLWQKDVKAALPEDPYSGIGVTAHGYASHTPVSDGKNIYAFFGKSGVHAFDLDGKELWQAEVGNESDPTKWGSSSSPIVYKNVLIVTASAESQSIIGFDKDSGEELWRQPAKGLDGMWGTPTLVKVDENRTDVVMNVAKELWGLNPMTGKLRWHATGTETAQAYASVVLDGSRVFAFWGSRGGGGCVAVDAGGSGDVTESNMVWKGRDTAGYPSPVRHESRIFVVNRGVLTVVDAENGERLQQLRMKGAEQTGGRFGSLDYPSPIVAGKHLFCLNGSGQMYVFELGGEELKQVALNKVTAEKEVFWGTPAVSNGNLVLRSAKHLYCVANKNETVGPDDNLMAKVEDEPDAPEAGGGRRGGGRQQFNPGAMFDGMDSDKDGKMSEEELKASRMSGMAERVMTLDKDGDKAISKEEFTTGIASLFRGGGGGNRGGGNRGGGRGGYEPPKDSRPDRPQRPASDG